MMLLLLLVVVVAAAAAGGAAAVTAVIVVSDFVFAVFAALFMHIEEYCRLFHLVKASSSPPCWRLLQCNF